MPPESSRINLKRVPDVQSGRTEMSVHMGTNNPDIEGIIQILNQLQTFNRD
jgi:hypothetical protein